MEQAITLVEPEKIEVRQRQTRFPLPKRLNGGFGLMAALSSP